MKHPTREEWMAYLYGECAGKEQTKLDGHLQECQECRAEVAASGETMRAMDAWQLPAGGKGALSARAVTGWVSRWAVAAALLVAMGYGVGRLSAAKPADVEQLSSTLKAQLEPEIRQNLRRELNRDWQTTTAGVLAQLEEQRNRQTRREMNEWAKQVLAVSNVRTNQLLTELVQSISSAQQQDRLWLVAALDQIEQQRLQEDALLRNGMATLALQTGDELRRTKEDMVQLIAYSHAQSTIPKMDEGLNNSTEGSKQ